MGELIRNFNWSATSLGPADQWPGSLRTALGIILHSKFPMFIFWGDEYLCFYNDAYRPSLGATGKHPGVLGMPGKQAWSEVWDQIGPQLDQVFTGGESTWNEDILLPIYRNGRLEEVYWTFSYSPIHNDDDKVAGVFVAVTETTDKVNALKKLKTSEQHFRDLVKNAPVAIAIFRGFDLVVEMANDAYMPLVGKTKEEFIGKPLFESIPEAKEILEPLAHDVLRTGKPFHAREFEIVLNRFGKDEVCYFNSVYEAMYEADGTISGMIVVANEVTEHVLARKKVEESEQRFRNLLDQAPDPILILKGDDLRLEVANKPLFDLWQVGEESIGKPLLEILPEMKDQVYYDMLMDVYCNGITHHGYEMPVYFIRENGLKETGYFNFVYHPYREKDETVTGVLVLASNVTSQVISKKQLEENKADLNLAVEIAELGTFKVDALNKSATYSDRIMEWFGLTAHHLSLDKVFASIHPDDLEKVKLAIEDSLKSEAKSLHDVTYTVVHPVTGKTRILRSIGKTIFSDRGEPISITGIIHDITALANEKQRIEESEKNLRNLILQAPVAMCLLKGEDFVVEVANDRMFELWGKEAKELINKPIFDGLPEARGQGLEQLISNVYKTGETFSALATPVMLPRNGKTELVYLHFVYEAYKNAEGVITGVMAVAVDVTEQVLARQETELAEERARLAIESAELGVYEVTYANNSIISNKRLDTIFGVEPSTSLHAYAAAIHPEDKAHREAAHLQAKTSGKLFYEARVVWKDGSVHWIRMTGRVFYDKQHRPEKLLGVAQDITEQKTFAEELKKQVADKTADYQEAMELLVKKNQELEQFAYVASHDLKEPLRMISSYSHLLLRHIPDNAEAAEYTRFMSEGVSRMQALINDLLEYSRIGQKPIPPVDVDCNMLMRQVEDTLHLKIEETGAVIHYPQLPVIKGAPTLLSQLFQNLIDNAIKFRKKEITPIIKISAGPKEQMVQFTVEDNGIGISPEYQDRIFVIFQRLHTRDQYPGTGIGLSVCKRIVELHGGEIWVKSEKNKGTTFFFTLPAAEQA